MVLAGGGTKSHKGGCKTGENRNIFKPRIVGVVKAADHGGGGERGEGL